MGKWVLSWFLTTGKDRNTSERLSHGLLEVKIDYLPSYFLVPVVLRIERIPILLPEVAHDKVHGLVEMRE